MPIQIAEWSNLVLRWFHVVFAIAWVGSTYSFVKLARLLAAQEQVKDGSSPAWLVQGGDVFTVQSRGSQPLLPARRFTLVFEALGTFLSGFLLLGLLYYSGGLLLNDDATIGLGKGVALGIGVLLVGWTVYDLIWISPLGRVPLAAGGLCVALLAGLTFELNKCFSGRAVFIHIGALFGTILTANLLMRVIPAQRKIAAALALGQPPDPSLGDRARMRSRHNLLLAVPVVFLMISNHFPLIYGHGNNWVILLLLVLAGALAGKAIFGI